MLKNRHKALTLWAKARDYECQQAMKKARQFNEDRYTKEVLWAQQIDTSQQLRVQFTC